MIFIAHRGNIDGKNSETENTEKQIDIALKEGYYVEVDIWVHPQTNDYWFGHDEPMYRINGDKLNRYFNLQKILFHAKNNLVLYRMEMENKNRIAARKINYFWLNNDEYTVSSLGWNICHHNSELLKNSICMMPELRQEIRNIEFCKGICSDNIKQYRRTI